VLANPPFSGRVDKDRIVEDVKVGTTTATELLFLKYMMDSLRPGGRCGVIVPEGVLFGSTGAHKELRRQLIENNRVEAVLSPARRRVPALFGVKTSVLFFRKGGSTERAVPARRQRRLQAGRQPRHPHRGRRPARPGRGVQVARARLMECRRGQRRAMVVPDAKNGCREVVVRR
jgi:hypothetical protein